MLGAFTALVFVVVFFIRIYVLKLFVKKTPLINQAKRQFFCEYALVLLAGIFIIFLDYFSFSIPFVNGIVFFIGFIGFGFFIAIDMSLDRERTVITKALDNNIDIKIHKQFYPLTRKFFIVAFVTNIFVMIIIMLIIGRDLAWLASMDIEQMNIMMGTTTNTIFKEIAIVMITLLVLVTNILYSYAKNLKILFQTETGVLESVSNGDLSKFVPIATRDEFGLIANYTNKMIIGLRDRIRMLTRLNIAKKVQENLLPNNAPDFQDLEISGRSKYCEEVGGDYFDFFKLSENRIGIVLTDASGHGVGAGLHMATIRAFLRYGAQDYKSPKQLISSVNTLLTQDSYESGRFTTLFFVEIDQANKIIKWIRAGHEPGLFFAPDSDKFQKLLGNGMALGVDADTNIYEYEINGWQKGSILIITSDGLKESRNATGEMYGEKRIIKVIENNKTQSAAIIEKKVFEDLNNFCQNVPIADDITIVIVKFF